jgi:hypothetical protein
MVIGVVLAFLSDPAKQQLLPAHRFLLPSFNVALFSVPCFLPKKNHKIKIWCCHLATASHSPFTAKTKTTLYIYTYIFVEAINERRCRFLVKNLIILLYTTMNSVLQSAKCLVQM